MVISLLNQLFHFNQQTQNGPEALRPLGYILNLEQISKAKRTLAMKSAESFHLYWHDILSLIFGSLVEIQGREGGLPYQFFYRRAWNNALLFCP
jgi:hypothetical protein